MLLYPHERLRAAMRLKFSTIKEFSEGTGIPYPSLRDYLSGKKLPGFDALVAITTQTGASADWLLTGTGCVTSEDRAKGVVDTELLSQVIESVDLLLEKCDRTLASAKKAQVISVLYHTFAAGKDIDPVIVHQLVSLAA